MRSNENRGSLGRDLCSLNSPVALDLLLSEIVAPVCYQNIGRVIRRRGDTQSRRGGKNGPSAQSFRYTCHSEQNRNIATHENGTVMLNLGA